MVATDLAGDLRRLASLHSELRERMSRSPLMDAKRLNRDLEAAYRGMWDAMMALRQPRPHPLDQSGSPAFS